MNRYLIVATEAELQLLQSRTALDAGYKPIVTGVGGTNVIRALKGLPRKSKLWNVGYCGSNRYPVGHVLMIGSTRLWHPNVDFKEEVFNLTDVSDTICLTAGDFVLNGEDLPVKSVVDMELAYIAAFGFQSLRAVKYVSDNLNLKQYNQTIKNTHENIKG